MADAAAPEEAADEGLEPLLHYIRDARGFDFTGYKRASLARRIRKQMQAHGVDTFTDYQDLLERQPREMAELFDTILINVTSFFRDRQSWEYLAADVLPELVLAKPHDEPLRVWSVGCATGEEAYSLAMLLCDALGEERFRHQVKIYATDVDEGALTFARQGRYRFDQVKSALAEEQIDRYFSQAEGDLMFRKELRRPLIFGRHDLVQDPPISRIDLLVCRNTLMYFVPETQHRILKSFRFALSEGGFLFLGKSEALVTRTNLFTIRSVKHHVFQRSISPERSGPPPALPATSPASDDGSPLARLGEMALETSPVAQLVIDQHHTVVIANRQARLLLGMGTQQMRAPFESLVLTHNRPELVRAVDEVLQERHSVLLGTVELQPMNGRPEPVEVQVQPVADEPPAVGMSFVQTGGFRRLRDELERSQAELERSRAELESAYEELQSTVEELETTNEELQSTNEELETTNEELHSTNEELETMNEELQSTNEELETMNNELRQRSTELDDVNRYLEAILGSFSFAIAVLDKQMGVRTWNREAADMWGVWPHEAVSLHFLNLDIGLPGDKLRQPIRDCLSGATQQEELVLSSVNRRGRSFDCRVRIVPLTPADQHAEVIGVIVVMEPSTGSTGGGETGER